MTKIIVVIFLVGGGVVGYFDALIALDEGEAEQELQWEDELYQLDRQIAQLEAVVQVEARVLDVQAEETEQKLGQELQQIEEEKKSQLFKTELLQREQVVKEKQAVKREREMSDQRRLESLQKRQDKLRELRQSREEVKRAPALVKPEKGLLTRVVEKVQEVQEESEVQANLADYWLQRPEELPSHVVIKVQGGSLDPIYSKIIAAALKLMPADFPIPNITIVYGDKNMRRGMAGPGILFMKGEISDYRDFFNVLIHEFGHIYDLRKIPTGLPASEFYVGPMLLSADAPSVFYYVLSWRNNVERSGDERSFVSGYGKSNPQEDFAEAFALYILQGPTFDFWRRTHEIISKKYDFLEKIFQGQVFSASERQPDERTFDVSKFPVDYDELL